MGEERGAHRVLVGKPEGKRPLGRPRRRWEDNIKMDVQEVGGGRGDGMELASRTSRKCSKNGGDGGTGVYMREGTTSRVMVADRLYGEFYDFYTIRLEYFGYYLVLMVHLRQLSCTFALSLTESAKQPSLLSLLSVISYSTNHIVSPVVIIHVHSNTREASKIRVNPNYREIMK
jgi:hypothetical protein